MAYGTIEPREQRDRARDDIRNRQERRRRNNYDRGRDDNRRNPRAF